MKAVFLLGWGSYLKLEVEAPDEKRMGGDLEKDMAELARVLKADFLYFEEEKA